MKRRQQDRKQRPHQQFLVAAGTAGGDAPLAPTNATTEQGNALVVQQASDPSMTPEVQEALAKVQAALADAEENVQVSGSCSPACSLAFWSPSTSRMCLHPRPSPEPQTGSAAANDGLPPAAHATHLPPSGACSRCRRSTRCLRRSCPRPATSSWRCCDRWHSLLPSLPSVLQRTRWAWRSVC